MITNEINFVLDWFKVHNQDNNLEYSFNKFIH